MPKSSGGFESSNSSKSSSPSSVAPYMASLELVSSSESSFSISASRLSAGVLAILANASNF